MSTMIIKRGTVKKQNMQSTTLLHFKETKEMVLSNYVKKTKECKKKISENITFMPLNAF